VLLLAAASGGCYQSQPERPASQPAPRSRLVDNPPEPLRLKPLPLPNAPTEQWLKVQQLCASAKGGWAEGRFDPQSNKIRITTHEVQAFSVDASIIPIQWDSLVVLSLDDENSELLRRDAPVLHFFLDEHGLWTIKEPPRTAPP